MKKYIIALILAVILSNCEVKVKQAQAQDPTHVSIRAYNGVDIEVKKPIINGMQYAIIYEFAGYRGTMCVVNLTKDSLEVELIKKQLNK